MQHLMASRSIRIDLGSSSLVGKSQVDGLFEHHEDGIHKPICHPYVYVCMHVCMYVRMYVCIYVCRYVRMYVRTYVCTYVRTYVCICVHMYICTYTQFPHINSQCRSKQPGDPIMGLRIALNYSSIPSDHETSEIGQWGSAMFHDQPGSPYLSGIANCINGECVDPQGHRLSCSHWCNLKKNHNSYCDGSSKPQAPGISGHCSCEIVFNGFQCVIPTSGQNQEANKL